MFRNFRIINETRGALPRFSFEEMKDTVLGKRYDLTLIVTDSKRIKKLNTIYRGKENPTDILSFPISDNEGEIYMCPAEAKKEARKFNRSYDNFFAYLFIHGCTHLKGYDHGGIMDSVEAKIRSKFGI